MSVQFNHQIWSLYLVLFQSCDQHEGCKAEKHLREILTPPPSFSSQAWIIILQIIIRSNLIKMYNMCDWNLVGTIIVMHSSLVYNLYLVSLYLFWFSNIKFFEGNRMLTSCILNIYQFSVHVHQTEPVSSDMDIELIISILYFNFL